MAFLAWTIVILVVLAIGGAVLFHLEREYRRERAKVLEEGQILVAALVQANMMLFSPGPDNLPAQFLITFDPELQKQPARLIELAQRVSALKDQSPKDQDLRRVAGLVTDEQYRPDSRELLPASFTGGPAVYSVHVLVERKLLSQGVLKQQYVLVKALPGERGQIIMVPYAELPDLDWS